MAFYILKPYKPNIFIVQQSEGFIFNSPIKYNIMRTSNLYISKFDIKIEKHLGLSNDYYSAINSIITKETQIDTLNYDLRR